MKIKTVTLMFVICFLISFSACSLNKNEIYINGEVEEIIEVNTKFVDKGVSYPNDFTFITDGNINTSVLGRQEITYKVYSSDGELVKEMHRFVTVVDTIAPTYIAVSNQAYYVGFNYTLSDFVSEYSDNYDKQSAITISNQKYTFASEGQYNINITFTDSSNNSTSYLANINVVLDIEKLIYEVYKNQSYKVSSGDTSIGSHYTRVDISSGKSLSYYDSGSLHYLEVVTTSLGTRASIQISANYGDFDNANISFHVSSIGTAYSVGFATIDATKQSVTINSFRSTINNLDLETNAMLYELNQNINTVLSNFKSYVENTLHLEFK